MSTYRETFEDGLGESLTIEVETRGRDLDGRTVYASTITGTHGDGVTKCHRDETLRSGVGAPASAWEGFRSLCGFLSAWIEALEWQDRNVRPHSAENADLFPLYLREYVEGFGDEIALMSMDRD